MSEEKQVGIVLVSHSGPVAEAVAELARGWRPVVRRRRWQRPVARSRVGSAPVRS